MIHSFKDKATKDIWNGANTKAARRIPQDVWGRARRKLDDLHAVRQVSDLELPRSNRLHALGNDREDQWAIRINDQYRICFRWKNDDAWDVEITDYH